MDQKLLNRVFGILSFVTALIVYMLTVQPTVPFWDCGEFSAASVWQQVPHPPGAPLFLMLGKLFHIIIPFGDDGWRINMLSVIASSLTVWLLYLITVKTILNFKKSDIKDTGDALAVYGSSFVGALALIFSDTFWFNAVESEVYAMSSLFVALVVFLMMKWNEEADKPGHERYLLLITYLIGLSLGVHLLAVQTLFSIVFLVYFRKYKFKPTTFVLTGIISIFIFAVIYIGILSWVPTMLNGHLPFKNECREFVADSPVVTLLVIAVVIAAIVGLYMGYRSKNHTLSLITSAFLLLLFGFATYMQILLRSNANPPMNENEPKDLNSLISYLGREQYGEAPNWPRRYHSNDEYYTRHYVKKDEKGEYIYGPWTPPRREEVRCKDGNGILVPKFDNPDFMGEMTFLWKYQINHMYLRYFFWNFVGRTSDLQDARAALVVSKAENEKINYLNGYKDQFPIQFYALPLILGLIGLIFHFYRDPKMAFIYLIMFLLMGVLTAIYQNQQEPQPRERDYFYAGSFFVWCLWIGMGAYGLIRGLGEKRKLPVPVIAGILAGATLLVPVNMAVGGWKIHSRAGNYLPFDYSYNILQSTEENAIIFTNGDNDTFPLWFLQDVAGVRRDVRIVNLSLGNTLWYVDQLKNREPWGAEKIPLTFSDDSLQVKESDSKALSYDFGLAQNVSIPVKKEILAQYTDDQEYINNGRFDFTFYGKPYGERDGQQFYLYRVQDKVVLEILKQVRFERPIYFSVTVGPDAFGGLDAFFRSEGMAMRVCPVRQKGGKGESIDPEIMEACLMNVDNSNDYSTTPKYGFKFRSLNDNSVYYDEVHRRLMITYRTLFISYANYALQTMQDKDKCIAILDQMNNNISTKIFPLGYEVEYNLAQLYMDAGAKDKAEKFGRDCINSCMQLINDPELKPELQYYEASGRYFGPHRRAAYLHETFKEYDQAIDVLNRLYMLIESMAARYASDPSYGQEMQKFQYAMFDVLANIDEYKIKKAIESGGTEAALIEAEKILQEHNKSNNPLAGELGRFMMSRIDRMKAQLSADSAANTENVQ